jgi:hypothetical protein
MPNPIRVRAFDQPWHEFLVSIENIGSEDVVIDNIYLDGDPDFSCSLDEERCPKTMSGGPECGGIGGMFFTCYYVDVSGEQASGTLVVETSDPTSPTVRVPVILDLVGDLTDPISENPEMKEARLIAKPNPVRVTPLPVGQSLVMELCLFSHGMDISTDIMISTEGNSFSVLRVEDLEGNTVPFPFDFEPYTGPYTLFVEYRPLDESHEDGKLILEFTDGWGLRQMLEFPLTFQ